MAGDWIKMRVDLSDDPAVVSMACSLDRSEDEIVGKLHRLWSWADRHTTDGQAPGINEKWVDRYVSCPGFAAAMVAVKWLGFTGEGVLFPGFEKHNGRSAKQRVESTLRKRLSRAERDAGHSGDKRGTIPRQFKSFVLKRDGHQCVYCGSESSPEKESGRSPLLSIDHIVPESRGGKTVVENLATSCSLCNNEKNDRTPEEWGLLPTFLQSGVSYESGTLVTDMSHKVCDKSVTREEKRREEKKISTPNGVDGRAPPKRFVPPSLEEVEAYCRERGNRVNAARWMNHYSSNGWKVGRNAMKDWQAAVRTWEGNDVGTHGSTSVTDGIDEFFDSQGQPETPGPGVRALPFG